MRDELLTGEDKTLPVKRSTFLTILCVLTFLGSTNGIFKGITGALKADEIARLKQEKMNSAETKKAREELSENKKKESKFVSRILNSVDDLDANTIRKSGIGNAIASFLTLLGALLMWRLNKIGFYIYVLGSIAAVAVPIVVMGTDNLIANFGAVFMGVISVLFIAMYAFNLRDMK